MPAPGRREYDFDGVAGGIRAAPRDQYNPANQQLFVPAVEYTGKLYTNVTVTVGPMH